MCCANEILQVIWYHNIIQLSETILLFDRNVCFFLEKNVVPFGYHFPAEKKHLVHLRWDFNSPKILLKSLRIISLKTGVTRRGFHRPGARSAFCTPFIIQRLINAGLRGLLNVDMSWGPFHIETTRLKTCNSPNL